MNPQFIKELSSTANQRISTNDALEEKSAFCRNVVPGPLKVLPMESTVGMRKRITNILGFLAVFSLAFFTLGFAFGHGHWMFAVWFAAAGLAWIFLRGASDASLPPERPR
jgi:hypothetical protein